MHASFIQWNFSFFSLPPVFIEYKHPEKSTRHQNCKFYNFIKQAQHTKDPCNCELSFDSFRFIHFHHWYTIDTYITGNSFIFTPRIQHTARVERT